MIPKYDLKLKYKLSIEYVHSITIATWIIWIYVCVLFQNISIWLVLRVQYNIGCFLEVGVGFVRENYLCDARHWTCICTLYLPYFLIALLQPFPFTPLNWILFFRLEHNIPGWLSLIPHIWSHTLIVAAGWCVPFALPCARTRSSPHDQRMYWWSPSLNVQLHYYCIRLYSFFRGILNIGTERRIFPSWPWLSCVLNVAITQYGF